MVHNLVSKDFKTPPVHDTSMPVTKSEKWVETEDPELQALVLIELRCREMLDIIADYKRMVITH